VHPLKGRKRSPPLYLDDGDISSLSTTPKSKSVEEAIRRFSSPSKENSYVPISPRKYLENNESSSEQEIGAFERHTKGMDRSSWIRCVTKKDRVLASKSNVYFNQFQSKRG